MKTKLVKGKACKGRARAEETTTRFERVKMNPYLMIAIAVCAEVFADSMLKASQALNISCPLWVSLWVMSLHFGASRRCL